MQIAQEIADFFAGKRDCEGTQEHPTGLFPGLSFDEYAAIKAINWSTLRWCGHTMRHFKYHWDHADSEDTDATGLGRLFHLCLLEPEAARERLIVTPRTYFTLESAQDGVTVKDAGDGTFIVASGRGKARVEYSCRIIEEEGKAYIAGDAPDGWARIIEKPWNGNANACRRWLTDICDVGREVVSADDLANACAMAAAVREIPDATEMLDGADVEVTVVASDPQTGLLCKARIDVLKGHQLGDAKSSSRGLAWESAARTMKYYAYAGQAAFYRDLYDLATGEKPEVPMFRFLFAESDPPHCAAVYDLFDVQGAVSQEWMDWGRSLYHSYLQQVAYCLREGGWPGYNQPSASVPPESMELALPDWLKLEQGSLE